MIHKFDPNTKGKDFIVGDIHGAFSKLTDQLLEMGFDFDNDRLFCTGDLVDRGPESHLALDWLDKPWFFTVRGNHEDMVIGGANNDLYTPGASNGGEWFIDLSFTQQNLFAEIFRQLPTYIQVGNIGIVHANPPEDWARLDQHREMDAIWGRTRISYKDRKDIKNIDRVFLGHTILNLPVNLGNTRYIDTGGYMPGRTFTIEELR